VVQEGNVLKEDEKNNLIKSSKKLSKPKIAGVLLILAAILSIITWGNYFLIDEETIEDFREENPKYKEATQNITTKEIIESQKICSTIGIIISIFLLLAGIFSLKAKMLIVTIVFTLTGITLFILRMLILPGVLAIVAIVIIILSRNEFTNEINLDFIKKFYSR